MKRFKLLLLFSFYLSIVSASEFAFSLYENMNQEENAVFSPYSIFSCLSMSYVGAKGQTEEEMKKALGITTDLPSFALRESPPLKMSLANALWLDLGIDVLPSYAQQLTKDFNVEVQKVDFELIDQTMDKINLWTSDKTQGKIHKLLQKGDLDRFTRLVLTNALYFQGTWLSSFNPKATRMDKFFLTKETSKPVHMMAQLSYFPYLETGNYQLVALPFKQATTSRYAAVILLPKDEFSISSEEFLDALSKLKRTYLDLKIPKFCMKKRLDLKELLKKLGMQIPFTPKADFSGIDGNKDLFINKVVHEAFFCFDEVGVTAAAATATTMNMTSLPPDEVTSFIANKPFLFFIVELSSKQILFMGKLTQPVNDEP